MYVTTLIKKHQALLHQQRYYMANATPMNKGGYHAGKRVEGVIRRGGGGHYTGENQRKLRVLSEWGRWDMGDVL
jgi:hypothetical protein